MNGETCHQKIIQLLVSEGDSLRKESIAVSIHHSVETVAKALTNLRAGGFVVEFNGNWSVTQTGRDLPPNFDSSYWERSKEGSGKTASRDFWLELIDTDFVENSELLRQMLDSKDELKSWEPYRNRLLPYVIMFLIASGVDIDLSFQSAHPVGTKEDREMREHLFKLIEAERNEEPKKTAESKSEELTFNPMSGQWVTKAEMERILKEQGQK